MRRSSMASSMDRIVGRRGRRRIAVGVHAGARRVRRPRQRVAVAIRTAAAAERHENHDAARSPPRDQHRCAACARQSAIRCTRGALRSATCLGHLGRRSWRAQRSDPGLERCRDLGVTRRDLAEQARASSARASAALRSPRRSSDFASMNPRRARRHGSTFAASRIASACSSTRPTRRRRRACPAACRGLQRVRRVRMIRPLVSSRIASASRYCAVEASYAPDLSSAPARLCIASATSGAMGR